MNFASVKQTIIHQMRGSMTDIIHQSVLRTSERQNRLIEEPSVGAMKKIKLEAGTELKTPQIITKARQLACSDIRMSYSVWIMVKSLSDNLLPHFICNWDATQFVVGQSDKSKKVYTIH
jgi:hypothetical protein